MTMPLREEMNKRTSHFRAAFRQATGASALLAALCLAAGCGTSPMAAVEDGRQVQRVEAAYGVRIEGLSLSAHGYLLDLRYRVTDPDKAAPLLDAKKTVHLVDDARNATLGVPKSPVIGGMRQTSRNRVIYTDRDYFILFVNPGRAVRQGDTLKLAVDGATIAELTVQ
jgi:hypothetical protein